MAAWFSYRKAVVYLRTSSSLYDFPVLIRFMIMMLLSICQLDLFYRTVQWICFISSSAVLCGALPDIRFGSVSLTGTGFGSVATYVCDAGYTLVGSLTRTCQASGEWSGEEPICRGVCVCVHACVWCVCVCVCVCVGERQLGVHEGHIIIFTHMALSKRACTRSPLRPFSQVSTVGPWMPPAGVEWCSPAPL